MKNNFEKYETDNIWKYDHISYRWENEADGREYHRIKVWERRRIENDFELLKYSKLPNLLKQGK